MFSYCRINKTVGSGFNWNIKTFNFRYYNYTQVNRPVDALIRSAGIPAIETVWSNIYIVSYGSHCPFTMVGSSYNGRIKDDRRGEYDLWYKLVSNQQQLPSARTGRHQFVRHTDRPIRQDVAEILINVFFSLMSTTTVGLFPNCFKL